MHHLEEIVPALVAILVAVPCLVMTQRWDYVPAVRDDGSRYLLVRASRHPAELNASNKPSRAFDRNIPSEQSGVMRAESSPS